jgi:hypothetical protein
MRSLIWILVCVLIPLVGTTYAVRMLLLSLIPARFAADRSHSDPTLADN